MKRCRFCEKVLLEQEETESHGLCHECYHLRRIIWRIGWESRRSDYKSDTPTQKQILSWLCNS